MKSFYLVLTLFAGALAIAHTSPGTSSVVELSSYHPNIEIDKRDPAQNADIRPARSPMKREAAQNADIRPARSPVKRDAAQNADIRPARSPVKRDAAQNADIRPARSPVKRAA